MWPVKNYALAEFCRNQQSQHLNQYVAVLVLDFIHNIYIDDSFPRKNYWLEFHFIMNWYYYFMTVLIYTGGLTLSKWLLIIWCHKTKKSSANTIFTILRLLYHMNHISQRTCRFTPNKQLPSIEQVRPTNHCCISHWWVYLLTMMISKML